MVAYKRGSILVILLESKPLSSFPSLSSLQVTYNTLMDAYTKGGHLSKARQASEASKHLLYAVVKKEFCFNTTA